MNHVSAVLLKAYVQLTKSPPRVSLLVSLDVLKLLISHESVCRLETETTLRRALPLRAALKPPENIEHGFRLDVVKLTDL